MKLLSRSEDTGISIHALREEGDMLADVADGRADQNFYPRPPRGGRHRRDAKASGRKSISIHALREEGDAGALGTAYASNISIHALREEGDPGAAVHCGQDAEFLSTPSARRATASGGLQKALKNISIHALREEGDAMLFFSGSKHRKFLSTPSARRATSWVVQCFAPLADFYPRPPRGGRPMPP